MSKELKIKGALSKDYQQIYIDDSPTGLFINEEGRVRMRELSVNDDVTNTIGNGLTVMNGDLNLDDGMNLYFNSARTTSFYHNTSGSESLTLNVGGDDMMSATEAATAGNRITFLSGANVTFKRQEATFSSTSLIGSGGTDDTDIDFRQGNKYRLEMTGDITTVNLVFPANSGNFILVCTTNGDHDVTNWKVFESDLSAATTTDVMWAGGSVPAFTNNGIDIVSFYWDYDEQQCYGVASLAFATP